MSDLQIDGPQNGRLEADIGQPDCAHASGYAGKSWPRGVRCEQVPNHVVDRAEEAIGIEPVTAAFGVSTMS